MSDAPDPPSNDETSERQRPTPARGAAPTPVRHAMQKQEGDPGRPTPVRQAMDAERDAPEPVDPPTLTFELGGETWLVRTEGRSVTGLPTDPGAPLLFLTFARESEPERRLREIVAVGRRLDELDPSRVADLFERARPFEGGWEGSELFPGTRKGRSSRR